MALLGRIVMSFLPRHERVTRYAELHYAPFGKALSRIWQDWPEVYVDIPWRVTTGQPLPLLLVWADADRFPVRLCRFSLQLVSPSGQLHRMELERDALQPTGDLGGVVLDHIRLDEVGEWQVWLDFTAECGTRSTNCRNHLAAAFKGEWPLQVRVDREPLPRFDGLHAGDPHVHSSGTRDMIEFGPPPELLREAARALELDWFALTDHSYDLDDAVDDFRLGDSALPRWTAQQDWIRKCRDRAGPLVLPGEELSLDGQAGGVLHLLLLGSDRFFHGSADGGESWRRRRSEWNLPALLEEIRSTSILPASAHTREMPGKGERWLLKRRSWDSRDMVLLGTHQVLSGRPGAEFRSGLACCLDLLRSGHPVSMLAGNDSHGHFSLGRSIRWPALSVIQGRDQLFGRYRSMVLLPEADDSIVSAARSDRKQGDLLKRLASGNVLLSNGPLVHFEDASGLRSFGGAWAGSGRLEIVAEVPAHIVSATLRVFADNGTSEDLLLEHELTGHIVRFSLDMPARGWLRAELEAGDDFAMTNPLLPA